MLFFEDSESITVNEGRTEALAKVTGKGKYAAEYEVPNICYAVVVGSSIAVGTVNAVNAEDAKLADGVIDILTHQNKPVLPGWANKEKIKETKAGLAVLHTDRIYFKGQPVAVVVANTLEEAQYAASLLKINYTEATANTDFRKTHASVPLKNDGKERGSLQAWASSPQIIEQEYHIEGEVHNPMEMHATIAQWNGTNSLKLFDKNQGVNSVQGTFSKVFGIPTENIEVITEFMGGGFGSGLRVWSNSILAAMAAKKVNRPVKLMLSRPQMFLLTGYRPEAWQKIKLGADQNGKFTGLLHQSRNTTSKYEDFTENITRISRLCYGFENLKTEMTSVPLNLSTPTWMRAPGECTGAFALETAIDELCYRIGADPVQIRMQNISDITDPESGKQWSTHFLKECVQKGAAKIGWSSRKSTPGQIREGHWLTGYGMAVGMWTAGRGKASAGISLDRNGNTVVKTAMTDIGTGTGTSMQNIIHDATGIPKEKITIELGRSDLPPAPNQGGSRGLSSLSGALAAAAESLKTELLRYASTMNTAFKDTSTKDLVLDQNGIQIKGQNTKLSFAEIFDRNNLTRIEVEETSAPGDTQKKFAFASCAAHFCRVKVHELTGKVKIDRFVSIVDGGKVISEKPARNQIIGAVVGGVGMTMMEEMLIDHRLNALVGNDLAGYHFPVNADVPIIEVDFVGKPDYNLNPSGAKGLGEVGIIGSAAAIGNAIYNATGKRFRDLPITPDKIMMK